MPRKSPPITIEEIPGDRYPDLESAQRAGMPALSDNLACVIRDLVERGVLAVVEGKVIPNPDKKVCRSHSTSTGTAQDEKTMHTPPSNKNL